MNKLFKKGHDMQTKYYIDEATRTGFALGKYDESLFIFTSWDFDTDELLFEKLCYEAEGQELFNHAVEFSK
jgi:hypothetical protein